MASSSRPRGPFLVHFQWFRLRPRRGNAPIRGQGHGGRRIAAADEILEYYYTGTQVETLAVNLLGATDPDGDEEVEVQVFGSYSDCKTGARVKIHSDGDGQWRALFYDTNYDPIMDGGKPAQSLTGDKDTPPRAVAVAAPPSP